MTARDGLTRRALPWIGVALVLTAAFAPSAFARSTVRSQELWLDSYAVTGVPTAATQGSLAREKWYVVRVSGTVSYYTASLWRFPAPGLDPDAQAVCGHAEPAAMFPSPGIVGPVGADAEMVFARPAIARRCSSPPLPRSWTNFQVSVGGSFSHPVRVTSAPSATASSHAYLYVVKGDREPATFRLRDTPADDNSGMLRIQIRRAHPADCTKYGARLFDAHSRADCAARMD